MAALERSLIEICFLEKYLGVIYLLGRIFDEIIGIMAGVRKGLRRDLSLKRSLTIYFSVHDF